MTRWIEAAVVGALLASGLFSPGGPGAFYLSLGIAFAGIAGVILLGATLTMLLAERSPERLQGPRTRPALAWRGARDTALAMLVAACLLAWPLARMRVGLPTGLVWTLREAGGPLRTILQTLAAVLFLDAWLYWKHRILHSRLLFAFHRGHHVYRDPTPLASFAVGPVEALLTFWPILLVAIPQAPHWAPLYFSLVGSFVVLNYYLHCGVALRPLERVLPRLFIDTSAFHNRHHANAEVNFGEALTLWDHLCKTREADYSRKGTSALRSRG